MEDKRYTPSAGVAEAVSAHSRSVSQALDEAWQRDWGLFLRLARQVAGLSLTELAERSGLSKGYLSKLESGAAGARNPSRATLAALARALPSFRALAHMLDPGLSPTPLAPTAPVSGVSTRSRPELREVCEDANEVQDSAEPVHVSQATQAHQPTEALPAPLRLGWRELEVVLALLALDRSALPDPVTALAVSRALDRPLAEVRPVLDQLVAEGILHHETSPRHDGPLTYAPTPHLPRRLGIARVGDALVLAAALLASASSQAQRSPRPRGGDA